MKKLIILGIVSLFLLTSFNGIINAGEQSTDNKITTAYSFKTPLLSKTNINNTMYNSIVIDGAPCDGNPGEPLLPVKGSYILLPPNSKVSDIIVNPGKRVFLGSGYLVEPAGEVVFLSDIEDAPIPTPNENIYSSTEMYPGNLYSEVGTYRCKGYDILVIILHPVQYIPASGELYYYPDMTVNVETLNEPKDNSLYRGSSEDNDEVIAKVDNPDILGAYSQILPQVTYQIDYDLLIITSDALKSGFEPLKQAHDSEGIETLVYTVEDIYNNFTGVDEPEKIRNFIKYAYETYGIQYVLLGGDNEIVPARYLFGSNVLGNLPSDLYYSCLDGTWNSPETPNPSDMDISVGDPGVEVTCSDDLIGPTVDYTNYIIGDSSMRFNLTEESEHISMILTFNNPIDLSNENYFRFSFNLSRSNLLQNPPPSSINILSKMSMVLIDSKGFFRVFMFPFYSDESGPWETEAFYIKEKSIGGRLFNFHEVVNVFILAVLNTSITVTEDDFIRLDGIYFSDKINCLYGEQDEESDLFAEVYVGRACVDNINDVQNFTSKTISYMNTNNDLPYLKKVLLVGEYFGGMLGGKWGGNYMDDLIGKCHKYFYTTQGFPENKLDLDKLYDRNWRLNGWPEPGVGIGGWPKQDLIDKINSGVHIINHLGHGNTYHNMKFDEPVVMRSGEISGECHDVFDMTNDKYFFVYSQACSSGAFDNYDSYQEQYHPYDCIAEYLTVKSEHGAFAGIWNSRVGFGARFSTNGPSQCYNRQFWDAVFNENITVISKANQDSKEDNAWRINQAFGIYRGIYYELNYFGDPSISFKYLDSSLVSSQSTPQTQPSSQPSVQSNTQLITQQSNLILRTISSSTLNTR